MGVQRTYRKLVKKLASLKLAVFVILALAVVSAVGTIYEARYDTQYAQKMVYHSVWMYSILILLCVNLIAVMLDRWPWKRRHTGFILAHVGIIMTLVGAYLTKQWGVDGSMVFGIGEKNHLVSVTENELSVYSTFNGQSYTKLFHSATDFLRNRPSQDDPFEISLGEKTARVVDYYPFALRKESIEPGSSDQDGPAIRFQLINDNVNFSQWLLRGTKRNFNSVSLGPARVIIADKPYTYQQGNEILVSWNEDREKIAYKIFTQSKGGLVREGFAEVGDTIDTGWMGLEFRIISFLPKARKVVTFERRDRPTPLTTGAILLEMGKQKQWIGHNTSFSVYGEDKMYLISYGNRRIDIGFDILLKKFEVGRYQGTMRASSYQSLVDVPELGEYLISMNNPLKHKGFTFYQASFQEDDDGRPVASILSVNHDPGRPLKYLGSFLIVLGSSILFWFKKAKIFSSKRRKAAA